MLNRISLLTAVCMTASAGLFVGGALADDVTVTHATAMQNGSLALPPGINAKDLNSDKAIEKAFKAITEDGLSTTGFDNLVAKLSKQDYDRIKASVPSNNSLSNVDGNKNKQFTDVVNSLNSAFKGKYNQKFDIDVNKAFAADSLRIVTGEVSDPQLLVGKWPVDAMMSSELKTSGKVTQSDADIAKNKSFGGEVKLEKGRDVALASIRDSKNMGSLTTSLIHENAVGWKFDVPNNIDANQLYHTLVNNLTYMDQHKDQWPGDVQAAYRDFTHAVAASIYGIDLSSGMANNGMNNGARPLDNTANNR